MAGGRPSEIENIDLNQVFVFGKFKATYETMADFYGVSERTIKRYMADEEGEFCHHYKKGLADCKLKLSEAQMKLAIEDGNATMLVWLGKQHLGQKDKSEVDQVNTNLNTELSKEEKKEALNRIKRQVNEFADYE